MARIEETRLKKIDKEKNFIHEIVQATYSVFDRDGERYFQIDTYGKDDREMSEKISQSIQVDKKMALKLIDLLQQVFK